MMHILATLRPDRARAGTLILADEKGVQLYECPCLGKADNGKAAKEGNPSRDPTKPWGDTPLGRYGSTRITWYADRTPIGEAAIPLPLVEAVGAQVEAAKANGRYGLFIHAGRGTSLRPSYGCLRVAFPDFVALLGYLARARKFMVTIEEANDE